ncbi:hypothetical protein NOW01_03920 [Anoxybacillus salavatliensis]|jgi:hypothetical protein|uniref:hypothetical protein n=1 Tax=Anoxybacillus gonensis TaxID=198467 RepID=UPI00214BF8A8|nr:hypothetical protein [Anoxybacillus gonensis]MCQ5364152.1 hypothetical protein [Anoxybacillus gonensis]
MKTTTETKEYIVFADVKAWLSLKIQANSEEEAQRIAVDKFDDITLKELCLNDGLKLYLKHENGEVVEPNVVDFSLEVTGIDEEY